jgi:hypothetical protein
MSLVQPATLAARIGVSATDAKLPGAIAMAEAMISAYLGSDQLDQATRTERFRPVRDRDMLETKYGPVTGLTSLTIDGTAVDVADLTFDFWSIGIADLSMKFAQGKSSVAVYVTGWANEAALPVAIREAILISGGQAFTLDPTGRQKIAEAIGDWSASWAANPDASSVGALSTSVTSLLSRYRRPQL